MRPLTPLQRDRLIVRVAQSLAYAELSQSMRDTYHYRARRIVADLEGVAVHGASDKRAAELVLVEETA